MKRIQMLEPCLPGLTCTVPVNAETAVGVDVPRAEVLDLPSFLPAPESKLRNHATLVTVKRVRI